MKSIVVLTVAMLSVVSACKSKVKVVSVFSSDQAAETTPTEGGLVGIADLHSHPFADQGFGGKFFHGKSFSIKGISDALPTCESNHGTFGIGDIVGNALDGQIGHNTAGYPTFKDWPSAFDSNHQQMYYSWIERAYRGGLRLMVAHAVNSEALCSIMSKAEDVSCDDMEAADHQIDRAYELQSYIDSQAGGAGLGWLRIVASAAEARRVIESGKLAMVLGIEVDMLFGCRIGKCSEQSVNASLDAYKARGVRELFPVHVTDNAFGGAALYTPVAFNLANKILNGSFFSAVDCSADGITYQETSVYAPLWVKSLLATNNQPPSYPKAGGHCNGRGLTDLGNVLIKGLMKRGMLIDIDHMGAKTFDDVLSLAESQNYPLVSGHTGFINTSAGGQKSSEAQKTDLQLRRLIRLGGIVGPILHQGKATTEVTAFGSVANDCDSSSKAWAQAYSYALSTFRAEKLEPALAYGSDFNGLVHMPSPRFGSRACDGNKEQAALQKNPLEFPFKSSLVNETFDRMLVGNRTFDYNNDGFAQVGLLPEFLEDLVAIGMTKEDLGPLYHSAEAYLQMWERAEAAALKVNLK